MATWTLVELLKQRRDLDKQISKYSKKEITAAQAELKKQRKLEKAAKKDKKNIDVDEPEPWGQPVLPMEGVEKSGPAEGSGA